MIDIVNFRGEMFPLGFTKVYHSSEFKIAMGSDDNRKVASDKNVDILVSPEIASRGSNLVSRDSGLNEAICKLASKNQVAVGFSLSRILDSKNRINQIANVMQNIMLCRKYKVRMVMASFADDKYGMRHARDMKNFCIVLGMSEEEASEALNFKKKEVLPRFV